MKVDGQHYYFTYDPNGTPLAMTWNGANYYYVTNLQGDITHILDNTGAVVTSYVYNAWGKLISTTGTLASTVGRYNPLRYRGYVYDTETGLYYLQSRYYNPETGRFVNADAFTATGQGVLGNNMFAYCGNSPVRNKDITGTRYIDALSVANEDSKQRTEMCQLQKDYALKEGNTAALMALYGVDSPSKIPAMPDGAMLFLENITSVSITGPLAIVRGQTVVMDQYKYCVYNFTGVGLSYGPVSFPADYTITAGYVYGLNTVTDYCGAFMGSSTNLIADISGGAFAFNGVRAEITGGQNYVPSIGLSLTNYTTDQTNWIYGPANIYFIPNLYPTSPGNTQVSI